MRIIFFLFIAILAYSKTMTATYEATYGWFGTIATAKAVYENNGTDYKISTFTKTQGFAKKFVDLKQYYISKGKIKNGILIPDTYKSIIIRNGKQYAFVYRFDYLNRQIIKTKYQEGKFIYKKEMPFFANNDILTLYFNLPKIMNKNFQTFKALGGDRHTGRVDVQILKKTDTKTYIKANLYNKIFSGDKGILFLTIENKNWVTLEGMVKNVLKIGNLDGKLVKLKTE